MTTREFEALMIVIVCALTIFFAYYNLVRRGIGRKRYYYWLRVGQIMVSLYVLALYFISFFKLTTLIFGTGGLAMEYYRPAVLALVVYSFIDSVWRFRSNGGS